MLIHNRQSDRTRRVIHHHTSDPPLSPTSSISQQSPCNKRIIKHLATPLTTRKSEIGDGCKHKYIKNYLKKE